MPKLLSEKDPPAVEVIQNPGYIIFSGPHNGHNVPKCLSPCLGTDPEWFHTAHEAVDLYVEDVFSCLQKRYDQASYLAGTYSRLVCDLNAMPDFAIPRFSPEYRDIIVPENQPEICCNKQHYRRLEEIYWPYHDIKSSLIDEKRQEHGGVIVLDIHSFTPTWENKKRNVEIGTIRCEKTPFSRAFEEYLRSRDDYLFISGEPYRVAERPNNAAPLITHKNDLQYLGLEIRSDLIEDEKGVEKVTDLIIDAMNHVLSHDTIDDIIKPRNAVQSTADLIEIQPSWSI